MEKKFNLFKEKDNLVEGLISFVKNGYEELLTDYQEDNKVVIELQDLYSLMREEGYEYIYSYNTYELLDTLSQEQVWDYLCDLENEIGMRVTQTPMIINGAIVDNIVGEFEGEEITFTLED